MRKTAVISLISLIENIMSRQKDYHTYACDFETTVYKEQDHTEVWASASVELNTEDVKIFHSIEEQFDYFTELKQHIIAYYHNLKFDGSFWLSYLLVDLGYKQAYEQIGSLENEVAFLPQKEMKNKTFKYSISNKGQWYTITIKTKHGYFIEIRDSLKLLPFSLRRIGESFQTAHKKLTMEYTGFRYAGCNITDEEREYIANDVLVLKEALEIMFSEGHNRLTIGSCCLAEFQHTYEKEAYDSLFPDLYEVAIDAKHGSSTAGDYVRKSYKGGWCYLVRGKENKEKTRGLTADVNSLYPSMMHSESGNKYPTGLPRFWYGNFIPPEAVGSDKYFFVRVRTRFYLKKDKLPFIQIKHSFLYDGTEMLETSDVYDKATDTYTDKLIDDENGGLIDTAVELTLTETDYKLIKEHYNLVDFNIIDGCYFKAYTGLFDEYIDKYKTIKQTSKGARRELAKLFLNNLYGKMASNKDSSFKFAYVKEDKTIGFFPVFAMEKTAGYIPCGTAITSYARNFTIRAAQANYYGKDQRGFIYADTDSIHCDLQPNEVKGITVHPTDFCCWKLESEWDKAIFVRQKTYIEHVTHSDGEPIENPYYGIKCAGMPQKCKDLLTISLTTQQPQEGKEYTNEDLKFLTQKRELTDFKIGLRITGKLLPKRIRGGILLIDTTYEMR